MVLPTGIAAVVSCQFLSLLPSLMFLSLSPALLAPVLDRIFHSWLLISFVFCSSLNEIGKVTAEFFFPSVCEI